MALPTNIDATYPNASAADELHQQYHDEIHANTNALEGAYDTAVAGGFVGTLEDWLDQVGVAVLQTLADAKGDLLAASAADTVDRLAVGTDGHVLTADAAEALGVKWAAPSSGGDVATDTIFDAKGDLVAGTGADAAARVAAGTDGQVLTADSAEAAGVKWAAAGAGTAEVGSMFAGMDSPSAFVAEYGADEGYDEEFDGAGIVSGTLPTGWSWVNQDAATYHQRFGYGRIDSAGRADSTDIVMVVGPLPASLTSAHIWAHLFGSQTDLPSAASGYDSSLILRNSANGRLLQIGRFSDMADTARPYYQRFYINYYTDADTFSSTIAGPVDAHPFGPRWYLDIDANSASDWDFYFSSEAGCRITLLQNEDIATRLGAVPDQIGFGYNSRNSGHVGCEWIRIRDIVTA